MLMLPLIVDDMTPLIREKRDGITWFNHVYSDQDGPTGLIGPPTEIARFLKAYLNGGELDGERILSKKTVDKMTNESRIVKKTSDKGDEIGQGLGWRFTASKDDSLFLEHGGGGPGFANYMRVYPDLGLGIVIMANGSYVDREGILDLVAGFDWDASEQASK